MDKLRIGELYAKLKPRILELINTIGGGTGPFAPTPHGLNSPHHTGSLDDNQAPQFLKIDGTRDLIGNLNVANGITIDGVDISALSAAYDAHLITDAHTIYAHAEGSGTRRAYEAGRLNRSILAGNGLTGGGLLTTDQTLSVLLNASWSGLSVDGNGLRINTAAAFTWTNDHVFQGLTKTRHLYPELTDTYDLGSSTLLWRKGWLSELDAILFSQNTVTLLGGWLLISKDEGALAANVAPADTQIDFGKTMTPGDFVLIRAAGQVEYMRVGTLVGGTTYNVTRNLDGSGSDIWPAGTPYAVLGQSGQGRIELNAYDTPRIQLIRQGATYNAQTEIIRIGDLNGNWGYTSQKWGVAIGEYASGKANITIDQDGVLRLRNYSTDVIYLSGTEARIENVLKIQGTSGAIAIGNPPPTSSTTGTGLWLDRTGLYGLNSNVRQAYFGSDGKFYAAGGNIKLDSNGLSLMGDTYYDPTRSIKFLDNQSRTTAEIYAYMDYANPTVSFTIETKPIYVVSNFLIKSYGDGYGNLYLVASNPDKSASIVLNTGTHTASAKIQAGNFEFIIREGAGSQIELKYNSNIVTTISPSGSLSTQGSLTSDASLDLKYTTSHQPAVTNYVRNYNYYGTPAWRVPAGNILGYSANTSLLMPLQFSGLSALWFTSEGYTNLNVYNVTDVSPNHIPMNRSGTGWYWTIKNSRPSGGVYTMLHANGSTDYWSRTCNGGLNRNNWIQFCAWVYLDNTNRSHGIARAGTSTVGWWLLYFKPTGTGYFELYVSSDNSILIQATNGNAGWHCVGMRYGWASTTNWFAQLFVDGVYYTKDYNNTGSRNQMATPVGDFELARAGTGNFYLQGYLVTAYYAGSGSGDEMYDYYQATRGYFSGL